jgi:histidinol-phosphatase (PHP family)
LDLFYQKQYNQTTGILKPRKLLIDYHVHNHFSPDSEADSTEMLKNIQKLGIKEVCFTNHAEWFDSKTVDHVGTFDFQEALRRFESIKWEIEHLQPQFPDLPVKLGAEITYHPDDLEDIERLIKEVDFDFLLGSVHNIDGFIINSLHAGAYDYFEGKSEEDAYGKYFDQLLALVKWGQFDVLAHLDVCKKYGHEFYGPFRPEKWEKPIREALKIMKEKGLGIELNTRSLKARCKELFPHPTILKWAVEEGIEHFTLSSDAHKAQDAGHFVVEGLGIAKAAGVKTLSTYDKRQPVQHMIG